MSRKGQGVRVMESVGMLVGVLSTLVAFGSGVATMAWMGTKLSRH